MSIFNRIFTRNWLFLIPLAAAAASFATNCFLRVTVEPQVYGEFSVWFFIVSSLVGVGIVGFDQVLIRQSVKNGNAIKIDKFIFQLGLFIFILTPLITFVFLKSFGVLNEFSTLYVCISVSAALVSVLSIISNLQGKLFDHYFYSCVWKILLSIIVFSFYCFDAQNYEFKTIFLTSLFVPLIFVFFTKFNVSLHKHPNFSKKFVITMYISSVLSIASFMAFDGLDRFLIITNFNKEIFGDYFFTLNFLLAPVSIFVGYYSANKMPLYKEKIDYITVRNDYMYVLKTVTALTVSLCAVLFCASSLGYVNLGRVDSIVLVTIAGICILKNSYTILSTAYKVIASPGTIFLIATLFGGSSLILYFLLKDNNLYMSLGLILLCIYFLWSVRTFAYLRFIRFDLKKKLC